MEGVGSHFHVLGCRHHFRRRIGHRVPFHVLRSRNHFRRYRGRRDPFSCFALTDSFSAVPRASDPVFMCCAPGLIFGGIRGVQSRFHVLRARTHIQRYRGRQVPFSCFALLDSFSLVTRASGPVFMFCAPGLVFGGTEGVGSRFHVLCSGTHFRRCRVRRVPFSYFALPDLFSAVPGETGPFFLYCSPGLVCCGTEGVGSYFHVLCSRNHLRRCRVRRVPFSCFALPESFSSVPGASGPFFMFCAPGLVFDRTEGVGSRFHVLHSHTRFRRYRGRRVPFSCFVLRDSFSALPSASGPVFMFCAPGLIFCGTEGDGFLFLILRFGLVFGGTEGVVSHFQVMPSQNHFRRCRVRRVPFSCFALQTVLGPIFMFCAPGFIFVGNEGVESRFHILRARPHFRRYRGRRVPFSCFALPNSFL
jgi:hypothetical protein